MAHRRLDRWTAEGTPLALLAILFFIDLFLPWSPSCSYSTLPILPGASVAISHVCLTSQNGLGGSGYGTAVLALALFAWEALRVARIALPIDYAYRSLISAFLAGAVLLFTILDLIPRFGALVSYPGATPFMGSFAWVGLALALVIGAAGVAHWATWHRMAPGPPGDGPGLQGRASGSRTPASPGSCPNCGRALPGQASFCPGCGQPVQG